MQQAETLSGAASGKPWSHRRSWPEVVVAAGLYLAIQGLRSAVRSGLVGAAIDRVRRSEDERRVDAATLRHRDADGVIQRLAAAKWALESGRLDRGLEIVTETLYAAEEIVSGLLRDAGVGPDKEQGRRRSILVATPAVGPPTLLPRPSNR